MFKARIETFGIFPDDNEIDVSKSRLHAGKITHWPKVGIQVENLPQPYVHTLETRRRSVWQRVLSARRRYSARIR